MRILVVDNYDSYTFNLYQLLCEEAGSPLPVVIRNDQFTWSCLRDNVLPYFDCVVISPGPGRPDNDADFGVNTFLLRESGSLPILGVCLGHQGIASCYEGKVIHAPQVRHGLPSDIYHDGASLFDSVPRSFSAIRYHSLIVHEDLPTCLKSIAWTFDKGIRINMALMHTTKPIWGVQFHPESVCSTFGRQIIKNFLALAMMARQRSHGNTIPAQILQYNAIPHDELNISNNFNEKRMAYSWQGRLVQLKTFPVAEMAFERLFQYDKNTVWLDSARIEGETRWSYMGNVSGHHSFELQYNVNSKTVKCSRACGSEWPFNLLSLFNDFEHLSASELQRILGKDETFLSIIERLYQASRIDSTKFISDALCRVKPEFCGGFVGYLSYEMKVECLAGYHAPLECQPSSGVPDARFLFLDQIVAYDHIDNVVYLISLYDEHSTISMDASSVWLQVTESRLSDNQLNQEIPSIGSLPSLSHVTHLSILRPIHDHDTYLKNIRSALAYIDAGETYEVCLTTQFRHTFQCNTSAKRKNTEVAQTSFEFYQRLRSANPAPYAAYLSFNDGTWIACSSPERFLRLDSKRIVTMKPIKGTVKRSNDPDEDDRRRLQLGKCEKDRAENLMIVDLIRNDLNVISEPCTVSVPKLMHVETYQTMHQLVTTVQGLLRPTLSPITAIKQSFPPGSMTGAPKTRTVEILDRLEAIPRGVYSGCLGFLSVSGTAHFNVVIRTVIGDQEGCSVGAGGAIINLSDPDEEWAEVLTKLDSVATRYYTASSVI